MPFRFDSTLQHGADLVRKLAERNFLKIFLRCDQINEGIQDVTEQLEDCVKVFHVGSLLLYNQRSRFDSVGITLTSYEQLQTALNSERWRIQSEADRKRDMDILLAKIEEASENDEKMWVSSLSPDML